MLASDWSWSLNTGLWLAKRISDCFVNLIRVITTQHYRGDNNLSFHQVMKHYSSGWRRFSGRRRRETLSTKKRDKVLLTLIIVFSNVISSVFPRYLRSVKHELLSSPYPCVSQCVCLGHYHQLSDVTTSPRSWLVWPGLMIQDGGSSLWSESVFTGIKPLLPGQVHCRPHTIGRRLVLTSDQLSQTLPHDTSWKVGFLSLISSHNCLKVQKLSLYLHIFEQ